MSLAFATAFSGLATDEEESLDQAVPAMDLLPAVPGKAMAEGDYPEGAVPHVIFSGNSGERSCSIGVSRQGNLTRFVSPAG